NHALFQSLVCQTVSFEPGAIREALQILHYSEANHGLVVDGQMLELTVNRIIETCAAIGYHYETSWCLWAAINLALALSNDSARAISGVANSVLAILSLDAEQLGLFGGHLNTNGWASRMTQDELHGEEWLLAYEANVQGWLPSSTAADHV